MAVRVVRSLTAQIRSGIMSSVYGAVAPSERVLRTPQGRRLAEGGHALVPGEGRGDRGPRPRDTGSNVHLQTAFRHSPPSFRQDQAPVRLRSVLAGEHLRARQSHVSVLQPALPDV